MALKNRAVGLLKNIVSRMDGGMPLVTDTTASLHAIGDSIVNYTARFNEFCNILVNQITMQIIRSKSYKSHYTAFDKGQLTFGQTINEIYNGLCSVKGFDPDTAYQTIFQMHKLPVQSAFHSVNCRAQYELSIGREELAAAFTSWEGLDKFVTDQISKIWTSLEYDKEQLFKYTLAIALLDGKIKALTMSAPAAGTSDACISEIKKIADYMGYMNSDYNMAGVRNFTDRENGDLFVLTSVEFDAITDVFSLAKAFNMEKEAFVGKRVQFDKFGNIDDERLALLMSNDPNYVPLTETQKGYLNKIYAIVCDVNFFMFYTQLLDMGEVRVVNGLYNNYTLNYWAVWSVSPFEQACIFTSQESSVSSVTVTGPQAIGAAGVYEYDAAVVTTAFAPKGVTWSVAAGTAAGVSKVSIDAFGRLHVETGYDTGTVIVKATSVGDTSVNGTLTVTLS